MTLRYTCKHLVSYVEYTSFRHLLVHSLTVLTPTFELRQVTDKTYQKLQFHALLGTFEPQT